MRPRSQTKKTHALSWRRNQYSLILSDELTTCVLADVEREISSVSAVVRRILAEHYRQCGCLPGTPSDARIVPYNGR